MSKTRSVLAKWQLDDAYRLRKLIEAYMDKNKLTQTTFMLKCGYSQPMFMQVCGSENKNPYRPLSYEQVARFSKVLGCYIEDISPTLARDILDMSSNIRLNIAKKVGQ
jgi:hypothetical protein